MKFEKNENSQVEARACDQDADLEAVIAEFDDMFGGTDTDDSEDSARDRTSVDGERATDIADDDGLTSGNQDFDDDDTSPDWPDDDYSRTVQIFFPREASACHGTAGIEVTARDLLTWCAAANPECADRLIAIRDGFYSDRDEDYAEPDLSGDTWGPHGPEERAMARVAHAKGEAERLARRAGVKAEFARDEAETARRDAEEAIKWAPFLLERAKLKNDEEADFDRADELNRRWEHFVIERETWGDDRAAREDARRAELTEEGDTLIADQEAWSNRWAELARRVEEAWAAKQIK